jgi:hypothetical protein
MYIFQNNLSIVGLMDRFEIDIERQILNVHNWMVVKVV